MSVTPSQSVSVAFRTKNASGALVAASGTPTAVLYRNGAATAVVVTVSAIAGLGRYSVSWTNAGYAVSDQLSIEVTATISGLPYTSVIWVGAVVPVAVTVGTINADAINAASIASGAFTSAKFAAGAFDAVWTVTARTITAISDSAGVGTLLTRILGIIRTSDNDVIAETAQTTAVRSGIATTANVDTVLTEVNKIPRGTAAIAAGGDATRTKVSANGTTLVERIT